MKWCNSASLAAFYVVNHPGKSISNFLRFMPVARDKHAIHVSISQGYNCCSRRGFNEPPHDIDDISRDTRSNASLSQSQNGYGAGLRCSSFCHLEVQILRSQAECEVCYAAFKDLCRDNYYSSLEYHVYRTATRPLYIRRVTGLERSRWGNKWAGQMSFIKRWSRSLL